MITPERLVSRLKQLPALSATAVRLSALARDERSGAADFEQVIRVDPALTANLLRLVNSAYFGLRSKAETVRQAVAYLGLKRTSEVALAAGLGAVLPPRLPGYEVDASAFLLHCTAVAVLAERLSKELQVARADLTFTAGLLHDVGKLAIGVFVAEESGAILGHVRSEGRAFVLCEREALGFDHAEVGETVAKTWNLPLAVQAAARFHHTPASAAEGPVGLTVALVHLADALAHSLGLGADAGELARMMDPAVKTRLGAKASRLERVAGESLNEIRELAQLLQPAPGEAR